MVGAASCMQDTSTCMQDVQEIGREVREVRHLRFPAFNGASCCDVDFPTERIMSTC